MFKRLLLFALLLTPTLNAQNITLDIVHVNNTAVAKTQLFIGKNFIISKSDAFWLYFDDASKKVYEFDAKRDILKEMSLYDKIKAVDEIKQDIGKRIIKPNNGRTIHDFDCKGFDVSAFNKIPMKMKYYYTDLDNLSKKINKTMMNGFRKFNMRINPDDIELPENTWPILVEVEKEVQGQKLYYSIEVLKVHEKFTDQAFVDRMQFLFRKANRS